MAATIIVVNVIDGDATSLLMDEPRQRVGDGR